jgi:MFS family permease
MLLLTLIGGRFADRYDKRAILFIALGVQLLSAVSIGCLVCWKLIQIWHVFVAAGSLVLLSIPHGRRSRALKGAVLAIFVALCGMARAQSFTFAAASLIPLTIGLSITFGTANIVIQERAPDEMRGRVSSIAALSYFGVVVFSGVLITKAITFFGMRPTLVGGAVGYALAAAFLLWGRERLAGAPRERESHS